MLNVNDCPAGLEPPAGVRKNRKATVKKRRNPAPGFKALDPNILCVSFGTLKIIAQNKTIIFPIFASI